MSKMPDIEHYRFGKMVVNGEAITKDLVIFPDGHIKKNWYRNKGHFLEFNDIFDLVEVKPDIIIVGTGAFGMMKVDQNLSKKLADCRVINLKTSKAVERYMREIKLNNNIGACFHLTC